MIALGLALLAPVAPAEAGEVVRRALVVSANDGGLGLEPLRYAAADADRLREVLQDLGGFEPEEIVRLDAPEPGDLGAALRELAADFEGDDEGLFVFYYSGHADARGLLLQGEVLPYDALKAGIRGVPADVHLGILDACRSGAITRVKGAKVSAPFLADETLAAEGEAWIAASSDDEDAQESDTLQGSFFTHYLVSGLRGAADSGDGWVSLNEAYSYAYERTVARTAGTDGGTQHPAYHFQLQGNGDLKLTEVQRASAWLVLPQALDGTFQVLRQPDGLPVAEVAKLDDRAVTLALPPGRYTVRRFAHGQRTQVNVGLGEGSTLIVDRWGDPVAAEPGTAKGGDQRVLVNEDGEIKLRVGVIRDRLEALEDEVEGGVDELPERLREVVEERRARPAPLEVPPPPAPVLTLPDGEHLDLLLRSQAMREARVGAIASALLPGAGQAAQGRWGAGAAYLTTFLLFNGSVIGASALETDPRGLASGPVRPTFVLSAGVWALAIADAWQHPVKEAHGPRKGVTLEIGSHWGGPFDAPTLAGVAVDWHPSPWISVGLDRTGWVAVQGVVEPELGEEPDSDELEIVGGVARAGVRVMVGPHIKRFRPAVYAASGVVNQHWFDERDDITLPVTAVGAHARVYATPRVYVAYENRLEWLEGEPGFTQGLALGAHLGGDGRYKKDSPIRAD